MRADPYFAQAHHDLDAYQTALAHEIMLLQQEVVAVAALRDALVHGMDHVCPLCGGTMRDISPLVHHGPLNKLGTDIAPLARARLESGIVPLRWECQVCLGHDSVAPPAEVCMWRRTELPRRTTFAWRLFTAIPALQQVAYDRRAGIWYLRTLVGWFAYDDDSTAVANRLRLDQAPVDNPQVVHSAPVIG